MGPAVRTAFARVPVGSWLRVVALAFEVRDDACRGVDFTFQGILDFCCHPVGIAQEDVRGEIKMEFDVVRVSDVAMAEVVVGDAVLAGFGNDQFLDLAMDDWIGGIHQAAYAPADET